MAKRLIAGKSYNVEEYWDSEVVSTPLAAGSNTAQITIPENSIVEEVLAQIIQTAHTTGTATLTIGDESDADGFILEQNLQESNKTLFGNDVDEVGDYLTRRETYADERTVPDWQKVGKFYPDAAAVIATVTIATSVPSIPAKARFWVKILRLYSED